MSAWAAVASAAPAQPVPSPAPGATGPPSAAPIGSPAPNPAPSGLVSPGPAASESPLPAAPSPTPPPIIVDPPSAAVPPGGTQVLRVMGVIGSVTVSSADPAIAEGSVDQVTRALTVVGHSVGRTTLTVHDDRGLTRDVAVRVAYYAGAIAEAASVRISGAPASTLFVKEQALAAAQKRAAVRPGAGVLATVDSIALAKPLGVDDVVWVNVPIIIQGGDTYLTVQGTTRVRVENVAVPRLRPSSLFVSDYPETLRENGVLFTADLTAGKAQRFLYYHYNPPGEPDRRIVLKAENRSNEPAVVQYIAGPAGPGLNEMEVGHLSTQRYLVRSFNNEGTLAVLPPNSTTTLVEHRLPARNVVSNLLQLNELSGAPLHLTLLAQNETDPLEGPIPASALLGGSHPHARGIYNPPEFFFDYTYDAEGPDLEIPIGQIPLPNLMQGQALAGDYGVLARVTVFMSNYDPHNARSVALYANPRGGRATGTFIIDGVLVQAHAMTPFGHYKLRQYTLPPGGFVRADIITMPEGGSSYPLHLVVAPDDGSAPPGSSDSPIY